MGRPPLEPGCHQQLNVSFSGDLQPSRAGFPGGDEPGKRSNNTRAQKVVSEFKIGWIDKNVIKMLDVKVTKIK